MNSPLVIGYRHTGIIVKNMEESLYFYKNILGLEVVQNYSDNSEYINAVLGLSEAEINMIKLRTKDGFIIELLKYIKHPTKDSNTPFYNVGNCHVAFTVDDADRMFEKLQNEGIKVISEPLLSSEKIVKVFFCVDPNGVRIELVEMLES